MTTAPSHPTAPGRAGGRPGGGADSPGGGPGGPGAGGPGGDAGGRVESPALDRDVWQAQLLAAAAEANRVRAARAAGRREKAARRRAGLTSRHAWRQLHLDARAADAERR